MNVKIALSLDDKSDFDANGASPDFFFEAEGAHHLVHSRAAMRAAGGQAHTFQVSVVADSRPLGRESCPLDPRSASLHGAIQKPGQWLIDNTENGLAIHRQPNLHGKVAVAFDETVGSVQRIDHPDAPLFQSAICVEGLFRENAIIGKFLSNA